MAGISLKKTCQVSVCIFAIQNLMGITKQYYCLYKCCPALKDYNTSAKQGSCNQPSAAIEFQFM